jgi:hypothetical protein
LALELVNVVIHTIILEHAYRILHGLKSSLNIAEPEFLYHKSYLLLKLTLYCYLAVIFIEGLVDCVDGSLERVVIIKGRKFHSEHTLLFYLEALERFFLAHFALGH